MRATLTEMEVARIRRLLWDIDKGLGKTKFKPHVETRTRNIRLILTKAERREKRINGGLFNTIEI